ncbi:hypothetical protein DFH05DRAFT_1543957 [Lentinula detonsa]|uniref:JmjC domain-containing protein n=1 Tax=Lentinula detonsa TaxID=2804962 RepID=A0A9W8NZ60_9AGAR|nr:hypothetical protein DFH05DRAFT_1543957 [Lentinula detonsa]
MFFSWEAQAGCLEDNLLSTSLANVITAAHGQDRTNLQETTSPSPPPIPSTTGVIPAGPSPPTIPSTTSVIPDKPETNPEGEGDKENPKNDVISVLTELDKPDDEPTDPDKSNDEPMDPEEPDESDKSSSQSKSGSERDKDWNPKDLSDLESNSTVSDKPNHIFNSLSDMEVLGEETLYNFALLKNRNSPSFHPNDSHFKATLEELIKSAELRQAIINCLDISIPSTKAPGCQGLATQAEAEGYIRERVDQEGMYWAIAGQKGAYSLLHMDANGLCTVVEPMTGQKYWVIARPKDDVIMSSIDLMDILNIELKDISPFWNFYAVILQPGDIFIMRPATPHYVMTVEDFLCFGSHCYSSQTLTQTALGIYHTLTTGGLIRTNTSHPQALESLCHISMWWQALVFLDLSLLMFCAGLPLAHKPYLTIVEDVIGFLDLVNLVTLAPVLDV